MSAVARIPVYTSCDDGENAMNQTQAGLTSKAAARTGGAQKASDIFIRCLEAKWPGADRPAH
jgi:hypothetical protein